MATKRQIDAARTNIKKAQAASRRKRKLANLPASTRTALGKQGALARTRLGGTGGALEDRNRQQIYALASQYRIAGRSAMGKSELIDAIRKVR